MGRVVRERRTISLKNPVQKVSVVSSDRATVEGLEQVKTYIHEELNMRDLEFTTNDKEWCVLKAEANSKNLGKRLGKALSGVRKQVEQMTHDDVSAFLATKSVTFGEYVLSGDDVLVKREFKGDKTIYEADVSPSGNLTVIIDTREDEQLKLQGCAREFITRVQKLRKKAGLVLQDKIQVYFAEKNGASTITSAVQAFVGMITTSLGTTPAPLALLPAHSVTIITEDADFADSSISIVVTRPAVFFATDVANGSVAAAEDIKAYVASMEYADVKTALSASSSLEIQIQEHKVTLQHKKQLFLDAKEFAAASGNAEWQWLNQA
jgi:isoleucyl-tRNA synthetase